MIYVSIFACVLALAAVVCAVLAWITSLRLRAALASLQSTTASALTSSAARLDAIDSTITKLQSTAPSVLAAEVAELSEAVGKLRDTQRRFQGRFDQYVNDTPRNAQRNGLDRDELRRQHLQVPGQPR